MEQLKKWLNTLRTKIAKAAPKRGKKNRESAFSVIAVPVIVLLVVLAVVLVLLFKPTAGKDKPTTTTTVPTAVQSPHVSLLLPVGEHKPGTKGFYQMQSDFYDYFYPLIGFGHMSFSDKEGHFADSELIQFVLMRLSFEDGLDLSQGVSKVALEKMSRRYFDDVPKQLEGYYLEYDAEAQLYYPQNTTPFPGALMSLQKLTVSEDGICTAEFYRAPMPDSDLIHGGGQNEEDFKQSFLNGYYEGLDDVEHIRMIFYQHKTADGDVYNVIRNIDPIAD